MQQSAVPSPVVFFVPAHNEEATVAAVLDRMPRDVRGHPVRRLVVDDGSTDETAARAAAVGAEVISLGDHLGLGAAVRVGLAEAFAGGCAAAAFCDADGEYAPEELERMVAPILDGHADYVVGSRFAGGPRRMSAHRWAGNRVLTIGLSIVLGRRVTDGQSGYRALSRSALGAAEIAHDYNYAQVLTVDLLGKGFRYAEVPISYSRRTAGRSFVRVFPYLGHVVPAVWRMRSRAQRVAGYATAGGPA
jgi:glycosyltransferase involved in cell wall biosynthesis